MLRNGHEPKIYLRGIIPYSLTWWPRPPTFSLKSWVLCLLDFALRLHFLFRLWKTLEIGPYFCFLQFLSAYHLLVTKSEPKPAFQSHEPPLLQNTLVPLDKLKILEVLDRRLRPARVWRLRPKLSIRRKVWRLRSKLETSVTLHRRLRP